jgi:SAM-dependent methyltransferase
MCASAGPEASVAGLNWGCAPGWVNSDRLAGPGIEVSADIRDGLPLPSDAFDYAVSIHGLQDLPYLDVVPTLREQRRLLRPGGVLRLAVPTWTAPSPPTSAPTAATSSSRTARRGASAGSSASR